MSITQLQSDVPVGPTGMPLADFLQHCARQATGRNTAGGSAELSRAYRAFVDEGLAALRHAL